MNRAQLFIGRLPREVRRSELEDIFGRYGRVTRCDIRMGLETAYAFIDYDDHRDAKDAMKYENGREFCGQRLVVDWAIDDIEAIKPKRRCMHLLGDVARRQYKYGRYSKRAVQSDHRRPATSNYPRYRSRSRSGSPPPQRYDDRSRRRRTPNRSRSRSREDNGRGPNRSGNNFRARSRSNSR